jgi:hypothetical protein
MRAVYLYAARCAFALTAAQDDRANPSGVRKTAKKRFAAEILTSARAARR